VILLYSIMMTSSTEPCSQCLGFLSPQGVASNEAPSSSCCPVCLGLFQDGFSARLHNAILLACEPYGSSSNRFSARKDPPAISLPGDLVVRYHMASLMTQQYPHAKKTTAFVQHIKHHAQGQLNNIVEQLVLRQEQHGNDNNDDNNIHKYPPCVEKEEQGSLALQVILAVPNSVLRPAQKSSLSYKKGRRRKHYQQFETQGGHPKASLEQSLELDDSLASIWTLSQAAEWTGEKRAIKENEDEWFFIQQTTNEPVAIRSIDNNEQDILQINVAL
jgi:hypothetical protein